MPASQANQNEIRELQAFAEELGVTADELAKIAPAALSAATKASRQNVIRSTREILLARRESIERRISIRDRSTGAQAESSLFFSEKNAPTLTSFSTTGGSPSGRGPKLKVRVRKGRGAQTIYGGFIRPNRNATEPGAQKIAYARVRRPGGGLVGRLPYRVARGPSVLGLLQRRAGFADKESSFLADETIQQFESRIEKNLARLQK